MLSNRDKIIKRLSRYKKIDESTGCWLWTGALTEDKYGKMKVLGKTKKAHQVSAMIYMAHNIDGPLQINHIRECKNKHCFNPDHSYIGTQRENWADIRANNPTCKQGYSYAVYGVINNITGYRRCRECARLLTRAKRAGIKNAK